MSHQVWFEYTSLAKRAEMESPKWSYASADFHDFAVTNHIGGFKSTMNASMMFPLE